jgi:hypothetical protein
MHESTLNNETVLTIDALPQAKCGHWELYRVQLITVAGDLSIGAVCFVMWPMDRTSSNWYYDP